MQNTPAHNVHAKIPIQIETRKIWNEQIQNYNDKVVQNPIVSVDGYVSGYRSKFTFHLPYFPFDSTLSFDSYFSNRQRHLTTTSQWTKETQNEPKREKTNKKIKKINSENQTLLNDNIYEMFDAWKIKRANEKGRVSQWEIVWRNEFVSIWKMER